MSNAIVEISIKNMGNWTTSTECLTILEEGFMTRFNDGKGYVQMEVRQFEKDEGEGVCISFSDDLFDFSGDYLPISLNKKQIKEFADYLQKCHDNLTQTESTKG